MNAFLRVIAFRRAHRARARVAIIMMAAMGATLLSMALSHAANPATIVAARTGDTGDGSIDSLSVTFSAPMDTTSTPSISTGVGHPGFRVEGYGISGMTWSNPTSLSVTLVQGATPDTGATPTVTYEHGGGGALAQVFTDDAEVPTWSNPATDAAGPVLVSAGSKDLGAGNLFNVVGDSLRLRFSEPAKLAGASAMVRWENLERAIKFNPIAPQNGCADGDATPSHFNFPQPNSGADPIESPVDATVAEQTFRITQMLNNQGTTNKFPAVPIGCKLGIDTTYVGLLTDVAGNVAASQDAPIAGAQRVWVNPADIDLTAARTFDGRGTTANGQIDAVELVFDQNVDDSTIAAQLLNIHVSLGSIDAIVDDATVDTGLIADDPSFYVRFTLPAGVHWDTGIKPAVSYDKPGSCTATSGVGLKGNVPTPGYQACMSAFAVDTTDGAAPVILASRTLDSNGNGLLDHVRMIYSEDLAAGGIAGWKIDAKDATSFEIDGSNARIATVGYPEATLGDTGTLPNIRYARQGSTGTLDAAANELAVINRATQTDGAAPRISVATVLDTNADGTVDHVTLKYSEALVDPAAAGAGDFSIAGVTPSGFVAGTANDDTLTLAVPAIAGTDAKTVAYVAGSPFADAVGNGVTAQTVDAAQVSDAAIPQGTVIIAPGAPMSAGAKTVTASFTEPMSAAPADAPTVTVGTKPVVAVADADHTGGWRNADPSKWDGTVSIAAGDCTVPTGCAVDVTVAGAKDARGNGQGTVALATEIDTVAPAAPTPTGFNATEASGESVPANMINMFTNSFTVNASVAAADAEHGTAKILLDGSVIDSSDSTIGALDTAVTPVTTFADRATLQAAVAEGTHSLGVRLCDDANNCTDSTTPLAGIAADYTPVSVAMTTPTGGNTVRGGTNLAITWDGDNAGAGFDHAELDYSVNNGASYTGVINHTRPLDGSFTWSVPAIDAANALIRVATVDTNGNKGYDATPQSFSIDTHAPVVKITAPSVAKPFVAGAFTVRWSATDASIARASNPISIQYSTDNGVHWSEINGGTYSHANDGAETWNVPGGGSFTTKVRVIARDAVARTTTLASARLARGVAGYVADKYGPLYAFGAASTSINRTALGSGESVRGIALRRSHTAGYVLGSKGLVHPFAVGSTAMPATPSAHNLGKDLARGIVLRTDTSGYVLDAYGRAWAFGGAPSAHMSTAWIGTDRARGIVMLANGRGGYVLDSYGRLYPFSVGSYAKPAAIATTPFSTARAVSLVLRSDGRSGWILDKAGHLSAFGGAPARTSAGVASTANAKSLILVTSDGGYWTDGRGTFHVWGSAFGNPTRTTLGADRARAAAM